MTIYSFHLNTLTSSYLKFSVAFSPGHHDCHMFGISLVLISEFCIEREILFPPEEQQSRSLFLSRSASGAQQCGLLPVPPGPSSPLPPTPPASVRALCALAAAPLTCRPQRCGWTVTSP